MEMGGIRAWVDARGHRCSLVPEESRLVSCSPLGNVAGEFRKPFCGRFLLKALEPRGFTATIRYGLACSSTIKETPLTRWIFSRRASSVN
jgi:hypothetical protein